MLPIYGILVVLAVIFIRITHEKKLCKKYNLPFNWEHFWRLPQSYEQITSRKRGTWSELDLINSLLKAGYKTTAVYHDLYVTKHSGVTNQIDVVLCTDIGLIVIEVKDYSGWIFGKGWQEKWTKITRYGSNKNYFYNPVKQNIGHIEALRQHKELTNIPMYSLIVFYGDCELKNISQIPDGTYIQYHRYLFNELNRILQENPTYLYTNKWEVVQALQRFVNNGNNTEIRYKHIEQVRIYT